MNSIEFAPKNNTIRNQKIISTIFYLIDDQCQYWLNKTGGTLTSPNFGKNAIGNQHYYDINLNCTWIINAEHGFYITLDIEVLKVNDK